jgi:hypothetical protein
MQLTQFEKAKEIIHSLNIKTVKQYYEAFKNKQIPKGIPRNPNREYGEQWTNWGDFLGTNTIAAQDKQFVTYEECQKYLLAQDIDSKEKFEKWRKNNRPQNIPVRPDKTYKTQWISWGEFFKTGRIADIEKHKNFYTYEQSREYLKQFNFKNEIEFYDWAKTKEKPDFIPSSPRNTYGKKFISMGDFLSTYNYYTKNFLTYQECKEFVQKFQFNTQQDFFNWVSINKMNSNFLIPFHPDQIYKQEFEGWPEFIGYQRKVSVGEKIISSILVSNNIQHNMQYTFDDCKDNRPLPFDVAVFSDNKLQGLIEYQGVQHFVPINYYGGEKALKQTQKRDQIKRKYCIKNNIPLLILSYKDDLELCLEYFMEEIGLPVKLDIERKPALNKNFLSYEKAKEVIQELRLNSYKEFKACIRPQGIPAEPEKQYKHNGWVSWGDFLGHGKISVNKRNFVSYDECKLWAKSLGIKTSTQWDEIDKPINIPKGPDYYYKQEWKGWKEFFS